MYLGYAILPQATMMASKLQQKIGNIRAFHLILANRLVDEVLALRP